MLIGFTLQLNQEFQSTHPVWGATALDAPGAAGLQISIHAPRVGCDAYRLMGPPSPCRFQSTHPVWGATSGTTGASSLPPRFQSTHPVWGATSALTDPLGICLGFQSTHPVWGATPDLVASLAGLGDFNPRTPCGVRRSVWKSSAVRSPISIHAPRVGCDKYTPSPSNSHLYFNPRTPCGVRLKLFKPCPSQVLISIHAPRVGCDCGLLLLAFGHTISIHAPRVGCDWWQPQTVSLICQFQSTHPVWGATFSGAHQQARE